MSSVNHPTHYVFRNTQGERLEVINLTRRMPFSQGNVFKYIIRAPFKGRRIEDLKKALWYMNDVAESGIYSSLSDHELRLVSDFAGMLDSYESEHDLGDALCDFANWLSGIHDFDDLYLRAVRKINGSIEKNLRILNPKG